VVDGRDSGSANGPRREPGASVDELPGPAAGVPSGTVTSLFTDVEGSTRRWEADAEGMRVALAAHDAVLRQAVEALGGWLFKHTGDGVCAAFASAASAVEAADVLAGIRNSRNSKE
jgi:class 3 adenylate cyclase